MASQRTFPAITTLHPILCHYRYSYLHKVSKYSNYGSLLVGLYLFIVFLLYQTADSKRDLNLLCCYLVYL